MTCLADIRSSQVDMVAEVTDMSANVKALMEILQSVCTVPRTQLRQTPLTMMTVALDRRQT